MHKEMRGDAISFPRDAFPRQFLGINTNTTPETGIKCIIHSLKARNFLDYDGITSTIHISDHSHINIHL
jgi:hypothetical protein